VKKYTVTYLWERLKGTIHLNMACLVALWYKMLGDNIRWRALSNIAMRRAIWADYSDAVTTRGTIILIYNLWAKFTSIPYPNGSCYLNIALDLSYRDKPTFTKYRALLTSNDVRSILDVFYMQQELDEGVYRKLLNSSHPFYICINRELEKLGQEPLNLAGLDAPFVPCNFSTNSLATEPCDKRSAVCVRSDGYLEEGFSYTITGIYSSGRLTLKEIPFMSYPTGYFELEETGDF